MLDNGVYVVNGWNIVKHEKGLRHPRGFDKIDFLLCIDRSQPVPEQLGENFIKASIYNPEDIKSGDIVYIISDGRVTEYNVLGKTEDGVPYIDKHSTDGSDYSKYPCNLITKPVRVYRIPPF
jgi:hypothetical protein